MPLLPFDQWVEDRIEAHLSNPPRDVDVTVIEEMLDCIQIDASQRKATEGYDFPHSPRAQTILITIKMILERRARRPDRPATVLDPMWDLLSRQLKQKQTERSQHYQKLKAARNRTIQPNIVIHERQVNNAGRHNTFGNGNMIGTGNNSSRNVFIDGNTSRSTSTPPQTVPIEISREDAAIIVEDVLLGAHVALFGFINAQSDVLNRKVRETFVRMKNDKDQLHRKMSENPQEWDTAELLWFLTDHARLFIAHEAGATNFFGSERFDPCPLFHRLRRNRNEIAHDRQYRVLLQGKRLSDEFLRTFIDNAVAVAELLGDSSDVLCEADRRYRDLKSGRAPRSKAQSAIEAANDERLLCEAEALASAARTKMLVQKRLEVEALMALNKQRELQKAEKDKASSTSNHKRKRRDDE
ncbi:hypothetical protein HKX48_008159, partial [Thoreauomyces humboldtii]